MSGAGRCDDLGQPQQLRADRQVRRVGGAEVDLDPDTIAIGHEANHATSLGEAIAVAHGEDGPVLEPRENFLWPLHGGAADEQDVAGRDFAHVLIAPDREGPAAHMLIAHGLIEKATEWIVSQYTNHGRRSGGRESPGGPGAAMGAS